MLTFDAKRYCTLLETYVENGAGEMDYTGGGLTVLLVERGRCGLVADEGAMIAEAGQLLAANGAVVLAPLEDSAVVGVSLGGAAAEQLANQLERPLLLDAATCPETPEWIYRLAENGGSLSPGRQSALGYSLVCALAEAETAHTPLPPLVAAAMAQIREHYAEVYGVEELAAQLGVSKSHLVRSFTAHTGISPGRYLTAVRVEAAKRLLLHRNYTLEMVATLCGFSGANYFCKVFKKATGQTPAAWRERAAPHALADYQAEEWEERLFL